MADGAQTIGDVPGWKRVAAAVEARRIELGWSRTQLYQQTLSDGTFRKMADGVGIERPQKFAALTDGLGWTRDSVERILAGGSPALVVEAAHGIEERLAALEADVRRLLDRVFADGPVGGDVVPFRPRPERPPPAAPAQPLPSAARETKGRKRPPRSGNVNRPTGVEPEPEGP